MIEKCWHDRNRALGLVPVSPAMSDAQAVAWRRVLMLEIVQNRDAPGEFCVVACTMEDWLAAVAEDGGVVSSSYWRDRARPVIKAVLDEEPQGATLAQLRRRGFGVSKKVVAPAVVAYAVKRLRGETDVWLDVRCDWCDGKVKGGCLVCLAFHQKIPQAVADPLFAQLRKASAAGDELARLALADFLEEKLGTRCGL